MSQHDDDTILRALRDKLSPSSPEDKIKDIESRIINCATKEDVSNLRAEIHKTSLDLIKWVFATFMGAFALSATLIISMLKFLKP